MIRSMFCLAAALFIGTAAAAQPAAPTPPRPSPDLWAISETRIASIPARIAFPIRAGELTAQRHLEFSNQGEGIDNGIQYRSADGAIIGTVYVYYPGLPHAGLAAFATDNAIHVNSQSAVRAGPARIVAAGGVEGVAIRTDYSGYRGDNASIAAFVKAGRWIVKFRVTGPTARRGDIEAAVEALLRGVEFGRANPPLAAAQLRIEDCPADAGRDAATVLPDPPAVELAAQGFLATLDGGGIEATDESGSPIILPSRLPQEFCRATLATRQAGQVPLLRALPGEARSVDGRTVLIASLSDSGMALEVVHAPNLGGYLLLWHEVGGTTILGRFSGVPSDAQMAEIIDNPQSAVARPRVPVRLRPNRGPEMYLPGVPPEAAQPRT